MRTPALYTMIALTGMVFGAEIVSSHVTQSLALLLNAYHMLYNLLSLLLLVISYRVSNSPLYSKNKKPNREKQTLRAKSACGSSCVKRPWLYKEKYDLSGRIFFLISNFSDCIKLAKTKKIGEAFYFVYSRDTPIGGENERSFASYQLKLSNWLKKKNK